jgi:hypothetical protein
LLLGVEAAERSLDSKSGAQQSSTAVCMNRGPKKESAKMRAIVFSIVLIVPNYEELEV